MTRLWLNLKTMKTALLNTPSEREKLLRRVAGEVKGSKKASGGCIADTMTGWLAGQYACATHDELGVAEGDRRWEIMEACIQNWTRLRRSDRAAERLQLAREQLELNRANSQAQKEKEFRQWLKERHLNDERDEKPGGLTPEVLRQIEKDLNLM